MPSYPNFPELSRAPQVDEEEEPDDPTIRDKMENGAVAARPRWTRIRDKITINFRLLTGEDRRLLREFRDQVCGWQVFHWIDNRDPANPVTLNVMFSKLPKITDDQYAGGEKRWKATFEVTEI